MYSIAQIYLQSNAHQKGYPNMILILQYSDYKISLHSSIHILERKEAHHKIAKVLLSCYEKKCFSEGIILTYIQLL